MQGERVRFRERHLGRLQRDARTLELGELDRGLLRRAFEDLGRALFASRAGVVRLEVSARGQERASILATGRLLGEERATWHALRAPFPHEGPAAWAGAKLAHHPLTDRARALARARGADEVLLFDRKGRLVEGARTNVVAVRADGIPITPPLACGGVRGIAREILLESVPELHEDDLHESELPRLRELVLVNAVRGARPVVRLDGAAVADGRPGPWAHRLAEALLLAAG